MTFKLGMTFNDADEIAGFYLPSSDRLTHVYVLGSSGVGKSKGLATWILGDTYNGNGCGVIDPHGDLVVLSDRMPLVNFNMAFQGHDVRDYDTVLAQVIPLEDVGYPELICDAVVEILHADAGLVDSALQTFVSGQGFRFDRDSASPEVNVTLRRIKQEELYPFVAELMRWFCNVPGIWGSGHIQVLATKAE